MEGERKTLRQLFIPICLEVLFHMLAGMVDTMMLSSVGDQAVGAVGTANTYIGIFIIMFSIISSGMIAVMTQYIGADRKGVAYQARQLGLMFNAVIGAVLSIVLFCFAGKVLALVGVAKQLHGYAAVYLRIVGGCCILNALIPIFSSYLRAFGHTKEPLAATMAGNVINLILNSIFLFGFHMGVMGVAIATVISRMLNLALVVVASRRLVDAWKDPERISNKVVLKQIVSIGLPSAMETGLYNFAMMLIIRFLNQMDADGINVTARSYATQISNFAYCAGAALAQANAILTGWRIGAGEYEECDKGTKKAALIGIIVAIVLESSFALTSGLLMRIFTDDPVMITLVRKLLAVDIFLEIGRTTNLVFGHALKTSGDAIFTTVIGAVFMYLCAVGGTWFFGIHLGMMVVGAYIGLAMDECVRAVCMFLRWLSGRWKEKSLIRS
ncbi:MAG: MATE family efflux transporter [Lachnospiraceae bacterium]|nr:MATE family efflux transporter [Lachnospiraceae bacterium]